MAKDRREYSKKYKQDNKEHIKKYNEDNKEYMKEYRKKYNEDNKIRIMARNKEYRENNKDKINDINRKYREENKDKINDRNRKYYEENKESTVKERMLRNAKSRSKKIGICFNISIDDIDIPTFCPVLGIQLKIGSGKMSENSPTLDRIIPSLGYVKGNISVISWRANKIKSDANIEELHKIINWLSAI